MPLFAINLPQFGPGLTVSVSGSRQADKKSSESPGVDLVPLSTITLCKHFNPAPTLTTSKRGHFLWYLSTQSLFISLQMYCTDEQF